MTRATIRPIEEARAGVPMSAEQVRSFIGGLTANHAARVRMAEMAIRHGNITEAGKDVWREYLAQLMEGGA